MTKNASDTATATGLFGPPTAERSVLDRRRNKLQVAKAYAASAVSDFRRLDEQLASNDDQRREQEASLQAALDRVVLLKKAIKASIKEALIAFFNRTTRASAACSVASCSRR